MKTSSINIVGAYCIRPILAAAIALAISLILSCSSDGNGNNNNGSSYSCQLSTGACIQTVTVSDCSQVGGSVVDACQGSSPSGGSSSSVDTFTDSRDGKVYKWVKIGKQTWMAENLNYNAPSSEGGDRYEQYGRLYDWSTAMGISSSYNYSSYNPLSSKYYRGVCPSGWHLPSDVDWNVLMKFVNPSCTDNSSCAGTGTKLKARKGWYCDGNGTDDYGFSALPGGTNSSDGRNNVSTRGYWWSASESNSYGAYFRGMHCYDGEVERSNDFKLSLFSVRCVQD